jgi:hypothetical protein
MDVCAAAGFDVASSGRHQPELVANFFTVGAVTVIEHAIERQRRADDVAEFLFHDAFVQRCTEPGRRRDHSGLPRRCSARLHSDRQQRQRLQIAGSGVEPERADPQFASRRVRTGARHGGRRFRIVGEFGDPEQRRHAFNFGEQYELGDRFVEQRFDWRQSAYDPSEENGARNGDLLR